MFSSTYSHRHRKHGEWYMVHSLAYRVFDLEGCGMQREGALCPVVKTESCLSMAVKN